MPRINLLPWREERRKRQQKEFGVIIMSTVVAAVLVVVGVHFWIQGEVEAQRERNAFLEQHIASLDQKIKEIQNLENERARLLARMRIIEQLQTSRPEIVHLFDEFVTTLPEGVYYTRLTQKGTRFNLMGVAQSNARVSSLMRNLDASEFLSEPTLVEIKARNEAANAQLRLSDFSMVVDKRGKAKEGEEG